LKRSAERQAMWFDRNGWMVVTPIALVLVISAAALQSSYAPRETDGSTYEHMPDWHHANPAQDRRNDP
jgi:hypothetical protein